MHSSFGLPYPAGHWFFSLQDLLDNPVFMVSFFVFWVAEYKNWLNDKERKFSYLFVLCNGELVYHEVNKSELL